MAESMGCFADLIFLGGRVITMEDPVEARRLDLAVLGGRILALGQYKDFSHFLGPETKIIEAKGKTLIPGLIDSHHHMVKFGSNLEAVDLTSSKVKSMGELITALNTTANGKSPDQWIFAWGYDHTRLIENRHPTKRDLDQASPNNPISIMRTCLHIMVVNSCALKLAGINRETPDPPNGKIGREANGEPNGILYEIGAMDFVNRIIPLPNAEDCARYLGLASNIIVSEGLTLVHEAGAGWWGNRNEVAAFQIARQTKKLSPRVIMGIKEENFHIFPEEKGLGLFTGFGDDFLKIGPVKFVTDGGIGQKTGAMREPFENSNERGLLCENEKSLTERMARAHNSGFQIAVHAVGDRAIEIVLNAYESILSRFPKPHRHRIEHATICPPDLLSRIKRLNLLTVVNPGFIYYLGDSWIGNLGEERLDYTIAIKSMLDQGIRVSGSSDRPVTDGNPWVAMGAAVSRLTIDNNYIAKKEAITIPEALKLYTVDGAYANFVEDRLGTLTPGKFADIVILDQNPLEMEPSRLKDVKVKMTYINGEEVFSDKMSIV